ncbi:IS21 family transposase [Corynebacterium cystitidis]|uniref:IS21 family transposase n=1 Tax=Corynebacterium cystitidis TaxID=35757 RepID=UPI00211E8B7A|nr:IS21 family transposase [Corynebacterium cystitidis]
MMATDYKAIMIALLSDLSWSKIRADYRCSRRTISKAAAALDAHGLGIDDVRGLDAAGVAALIPDHRRRDDSAFLQPDFEAIAAKCAQGSRVTMLVEHEKYLRRECVPGQQHYSYKQFMALFADYVDVNQLRATLHHPPGLEMQVDWAGDTMAVFDPYSQGVVKAYLFVASLPHSGMVFACATPDLKIRSWLSCHDEALNYFGGVPQRVISDNAPTATNQLCKKMRARDVNGHYDHFGGYFGFGILAAEPYEPTQKGHVESAVYIVERWVQEYLDDREFFSFDELNEAIATRVEWINDRREFRKSTTSRRELFAEYERGALMELPKYPWSWSEWKKAKVGDNYHIQHAKHFYSTPWKLVGKWVDVQVFDSFLRVFYNGEQVAEHLLRPGNYQLTTDPDHVPENHKDLGTGWDRERMESWAKSIGAATHELIGQIFNARAIEAHAYHTVLAILNMSKESSRKMLEQACQQLLDRKEVPSSRKVAKEIVELKRASAHPDHAELPMTSTGHSTSLSSTKTPRKPTSEGKSHIRGKASFSIRKED